MTAKREFNEKQQIKANRIIEKYSDERVNSSNTMALAACGAMALFFHVGKLIYECIVKDGNPLPDLGILLVMGLIIGAMNMKNGIVTKPVSMGKTLDTGSSASSRLKRTGMYLLETFALVGFIALADFVTYKMGMNTLEERVLDRPAAVVIFCVISFLFSYILGESKAKKYRRFEKQMDEDENDLSD